MSSQSRSSHPAPTAAPAALPTGPNDQELALWRTALEIKDRDLSAAIVLRVQHLRRRGLCSPQYTGIDWFRDAARAKLTLELADLGPVEPDVLDGLLQLAERWGCSPELARRKLVLGALAYEQSLALTCAPLTPKMTPDDDAREETPPSAADQRRDRRQPRSRPVAR